MSLFLVNLLAFAVTPLIAQAANRECATGTTIVSSPSPGKVGNHLSSVVSLSATDAWAVGSDQGQAKGESLVLLACSQ